MHFAVCINPSNAKAILPDKQYPQTYKQLGWCVTKLFMVWNWTKMPVTREKLIQNAYASVCTDIFKVAKLQTASMGREINVSVSRQQKWQGATTSGKGGNEKRQGEDSIKCHSATPFLDLVDPDDNVGQLGWLMIKQTGKQKQQFTISCYGD